MAAKEKSIFVCRLCGAEFPKWQGQCGQCGEWNVLEEKAQEKTGSRKAAAGRPFSLNVLGKASMPRRYQTRIPELDRVSGGGFLAGSVTLLGGDPGIGKSTLALQLLAECIRIEKIKGLYFSGEESIEQISLRASRLLVPDELFSLSNDMELHQILHAMDTEKPQLLIVDSIQTVYSLNSDSLPGSVTQVRECASELLNKAKQKNITLILIGHITKEGNIAGPKLLEHLVDTVFYQEGDQNNYFRILRSVKNRFGATNEIGIFEMAADGLHSVGNPGDIFLSERISGVSGSVVAAGLEATRPLLIEIQALAAKAAYGAPQRNSTGVDHRRLAMLLAVMEKKLHLPMSQSDVFVNIVGGLKFFEPAMDLPVLAAIISSVLDKPLPDGCVLFGEVGLTGELRSASLSLKRVEEAVRMGFSHIILPAASRKALVNMRVQPDLHFIANVGELKTLISSRSLTS